MAVPEDTGWEKLFPADLTLAEKSELKTLFLQELALKAHAFYEGKIQVLPKAGLFSYDWFNVWYTPGVSSVSRAIKTDKSNSYKYTSKSNLVAVVSDSTRVLGDGDVTPPGGLGVMEGKAFLMKFLGGVDAVPLCIDSTDKSGNKSAKKIIDFVKMASPSFGAVNLEDISMPNCFEVLNTLQAECDIPVWHDDAQGTASVNLAGLINALKLTNRTPENTKVVFLGAGAANTATARLCFAYGINPQNCVMFDIDGGLHTGRADIKNNPAMNIQWDLCKKTNPKKFNKPEQALENADVLIALSAPGPNTVKPEWISKMNEKSIVFVCANPIPEIYPDAAKQAGAFIVATGRGDFENQVNNSLCFPGLLKGALMAQAKKITDTMAIKAATVIADYAAQQGLKPNKILPLMSEKYMFAEVAAAVAMQAIEEKHAGFIAENSYFLQKAKDDIDLAQSSYKMLMENEFIKKPPKAMIDEALALALKKLKS